MLSLEITVVLAALSLIAAKPYEDTRHRFRVELPDAWQLSPQFGDTHGMVFQRSVGARHRKSLATLIIHVDSVPASDAKAYADAHEKALETQPGFERKSEGATTIGGLPALVREYKSFASKKQEIEKKMRAHVLEAAGHHYLIHVETTARDFNKIESDLKTILKSFTPSAGEKKDPVSMKIEETLETPILAGRWTNDDGLVMVLGGDGSFALAEAVGRYEVKDNVLTMIIPGQGRESFTFVLDGIAGTLTLSSPNLGSPMTYRRGGNAPARTSGDDAKDLAGKWITPTANGPLVLELRKDKSFTMGSSSGQWAAGANRLTLIKGGAETVSYIFRREGDRLALSGGDLEVEVVFTR
jgi:hypothetical protein